MKAGLKLILLAALAASAALAQMQDNREKRLTCENNNNRGDRARYCEIREQSLAAAGRLSVDAGPNGGATIKGWLQNDVLVRSRVEASADNDSQARSYAAQVRVDAAAGQVRAEGPAAADNSSWSVSYEIFVPQTTDLTLNTHNGGIVISDVRGRIEFNATNGGVHLQRVAGDVSGSTVNGGVVVDLAGKQLGGPPTRGHDAEWRRGSLHAGILFRSHSDRNRKWRHSVRLSHNGARQSQAPQPGFQCRVGRPAHSRQHD